MHFSIYSAMIPTSNSEGSKLDRKRKLEPSDLLEEVCLKMRQQPPFSAIEDDVWLDVVAKVTNGLALCSVRSA